MCTRSASAGASSASTASSLIDAVDTAGSPPRHLRTRRKTVAAIASSLAAQIYGLDILAEDIEDDAHNTTRSRGAGKSEAEMGGARLRRRLVKTTFTCSVRSTCRLRSTRRSAASRPTAST